ncbi:hypothetical protein DMB92_09205, partial [Campylobacter sp. MIT 99-7217]
MKKISNLFLATAVLSFCLADDFLAKLTQGKISDTSEGVRVLSLDEMKEIKGGWKTHSINGYVYNYYQRPYTNNYNANHRPQTSSSSIYSNAFMQYYKP